MGKGRKQGKDSQTLPFHFFLASNFTSGSYTVLLRPGGDLAGRLSSEADAWQHFKVNKLSLRLHPATAITATQACGYIGGVPDTLPSTVSQVGELLPSALLGLRSTVPTEWVNVQRTDLAGPLPWYKTVPGTADPTEESPGVIAVVGTGSETFILEIRGVFEFKTACATSNTPVSVQYRNLVRTERMQLALLRERGLLLRILGSATQQIPPAAAPLSLTPPTGN